VPIKTAIEAVPAGALVRLNDCCEPLPEKVSAIKGTEVT
jgi:hypothetical protein